MGNEWFRRPIGITGGLRLASESITFSNTAQTLSDRGVSFLTLGSSNISGDVILPSPPYTGAIKYIFLQNTSTSIEGSIYTDATANTFWGTTWNTVNVSAASTGSPGGTPGGSPALCLVGASTTQWAVLPGTTFNWDFAQTTGSTAQA